MKQENLHIGKMIKSFVREKPINDVDFAKMIGKSRQNIYDLYNRNDVNVKLLLTISEVLQHNFFKDIYHDKSHDDVDRVFDALKDIVKQKIG